MKPLTVEEILNFKREHRMILYTDTINGAQTCRDDLWAVSTEELAEASAKLQELINSIIGEDKDLTIKDIFGDDSRNNIGSAEIEAMHHQNSARRKLRAEQRQALSHIQEAE